MADSKKKKKRAATQSKTKKKRAPTKGTSKSKKKRASPPTEPQAPKLGLVVSVAETTNAADERARAVLEQLGCTVTPEHGPEQVAKRVAGSVPPDAVVVAIPGGEAVIAAAKARTGTPPVLIAAVAAPATTAIDRCTGAGADLLAVRPHGADSLAAALRSAMVLAAARARAVALESSESMLRERLQRYGEADAATGFQHFDFFKQLLVREIKRAKRYGYPLAACLIALDPWVDSEPTREAARVLRTRVASAIASVIRDIDLPVDLAEDRFLVFLPYTDRDGAEHVGKRVARAVAAFGEVELAGQTYRLSVSIGIAATREGKPISFARLMRDAGAAVRASQLKGGGRVVVRT